MRSDHGDPRAEGHVVALDVDGVEEEHAEQGAEHAVVDEGLGPAGTRGERIAVGVEDPPVEPAGSIGVAGRLGGGVVDAAGARAAESGPSCQFPRSAVARASRMLERRLRMVSRTDPQDTPVTRRSAPVSGAPGLVLPLLATITVPKPG